MEYIRGVGGGEPHKTWELEDRKLIIFQVYGYQIIYDQRTTVLKKHIMSSKNSYMAEGLFWIHPAQRLMHSMLPFV